MTAFSATLERILRRAWPRLLLACALSLLLHLALLLSVPVNPTGGTPNIVSTITARLEPAAAVESEPLQTITPGPAETAAQAVTGDVPPKPAASQAEPRPEPKSAAAVPSTPSTGVDLPLIRDPTYYPAKQLDVYPQPTTQIKPNYPDAAAVRRLDGRLVLLLLIDEFGVVNEATVVEAQPEGYFEEAAVSVFRTTRFTPAQKQGYPVKSRVLIRVNFNYGESAGAVH